MLIFFYLSFNWIFHYYYSRSINPFKIQHFLWVYVYLIFIVFIFNYFFFVMFSIHHEVCIFVLFSIIIEIHLVTTVHQIINFLVLMHLNLVYHTIQVLRLIQMVFFFVLHKIIICAYDFILVHTF